MSWGICYGCGLERKPFHNCAEERETEEHRAEVSTLRERVRALEGALARIGSKGCVSNSVHDFECEGDCLPCIARAALDTPEGTPR